MCLVTENFQANPPIINPIEVCTWVKKEKVSVPILSSNLLDYQTLMVFVQRDQLDNVRVLTKNE